MNTTRTESDSFGPIEVPVAALWGAQTARSLKFFDIGEQRMPLAVIHALAWLKWAAAKVNCDLHLLDAGKAQAIADAAQRVAAGEFDAQFPLSVWQTGSGTQSNMNLNEVVAHLAERAFDGDVGAARTVHPNDDVNLGQSSNDVFPSAMHIAVAQQAQLGLLPTLQALRSALAAKSNEFEAVVKIGRTHLQDATPVTLGQEFGGYAAQLALCQDSIDYALRAVHTLALGGTAVGTGLNTHPDFGARVVALLAQQLKLPLTQADNLFSAMAGHEALVALHGSLRMLAIALIKIANDIRLMGSGPRAGLGELQLPENEPGSSIMPGKVNPTQIEALTMVCAQVMGHDSAIAFAASQGQFELNVYKPLIILDTLDSLRLLTDAMRSFEQHCVAGITVNAARVQALLESSLMLVTALTPHIGYDRAAQIAKHAHAHGSTLREAALALGMVSAQQFDAWVDPRRMLGPGSSGSPGARPSDISPASR
ncbi:MAG: class II fumarate hydratase [Gammaproteobacteria bacterium]|uniref:class II fumarate hydratase n=1 Tax=Rhodoferax sp. TaxID=50421 RepID=UPI001801A570|nr:class II fumarate hydratase [Rhodoferax sp.]MBU3899655.1 class II fumarate hydratase [Gammaproteobacteria bacterium]MBA3057216.1 class II fumarate hydratase [Rhodoferax sp.]MBU3997423.1 class II fumarate hydratase [Gammaproteobacteria bacterium]MBU4018131.1 class II fumarate hydratase [Gammaproteobacteria bacterium]MBU4080178.1 class II fumarate hydratase [Gammaproteobacteria bacterium]